MLSLELSYVASVSSTGNRTLFARGFFEEAIIRAPLKTPVWEARGARETQREKNPLAPRLS